MANQNEIDYDKQFQDDLEKATALSLETLALDQFRRNKLQYSHSDASTTQHVIPTRPIPSRPNSIGVASTISNSASVGSISNIPPPTIPPRKYSIPSSSSSSSQQPSVPMSSRPIDEPDLISFANSSDPANQQPNQNPHTNFIQMVDEMHKFNAKLPAYNVPGAFGFTAAAPHTMPYNPSAGLQLVPLTVPAQLPSTSVTQEKRPLTPDQLKKLYDMNNAVQPYRTNVINFPQQPQQLQQSQQCTTIYRSVPYMPNQPAFNNQTFFNPFGNYNQANVSNVCSRSSPAPIQLPNSNFNRAQNVDLPKQQPIRQDSTQTPSVSNYSTRSNDIHRPKKLHGDLIDLSNGIEDNRVSVLEAFDPLLMGQDDDEKDDNESDCATSYYSEYDPFDYLYSTGTQYSDPVYEAVNKIDRTPQSPGISNSNNNNSWNLSPNLAAATTTLESLSAAPPLPPRNNKQPLNFDDDDDDEYASTPSDQILDRRKVFTKLYENVVIKRNYEPEMGAFFNMVQEIRSECKYTDLTTNVGHVIAAEFNNSYPNGTSIKLLVYPELNGLHKNYAADLVNNQSNRSSGSGGGGGINSNGVNCDQIRGYGAPVAFTCDICTTVEHVIMHVFCELEGSIVGNVNDFMLKPIGVTEWLSPASKLSQLECVHDSLKMEQDVQLGLCPKTNATMNAIGRTLQDDIRDAELKYSDIVANETVESLNYDNLMILLETLEDEIDKLESNATGSHSHMVLSCSGVVQAVKAICSLLGSLDTMEITYAIDGLKNICSQGQTMYTYRSEPTYSLIGNKLDIVSESGDYAEVALRPKTISEQIRHRCNNIRDAVQTLLVTYSNAFRVNFHVNTPEYSTGTVQLANITEPAMVHLMCLHRPPPNWRYDDYMLGAQIYHGTRYIGDAVVTQCSNELSGIHPRLKFDSWLNFENIPICTLPRESRLIFVLYGCTTEPAEGGGGGGGSGVGTNSNSQSESNPSDLNATRKIMRIELGWTAIQFFDFERKMIQGSFLLSLWPPTSDKFLGPAPAKGTHPYGYHCPVLSIKIPSYGGQIVFPESIKNPPVAPQLDFNSLDANLQQELIDTAEQGYSNAVDKREVLWEKRYYLHALPHALPKILHAAHSWDFASLVDLHALIKSWHPLSPLQALELFLPRYPDMVVRSHAVRWVSKMPNDQLVDFLPQLLQALKHDTYEASPMARLLLRKALECPRIAHHLYWLLVHSLPGDAPQNSAPEQIPGDLDETLINQTRYHKRNQLMLRALLAICGEKLTARFLTQNMMCKSLAEIAMSVKQSKESLRQKTLVHGMESIDQLLMERKTSLPLGPGLEVCGVNARNCSYFNSNTLPLKICYIGSDHIPLPAIFKAGDDLQQDMLTIQLVRIMDKLWLSEGLDLKMVTFNCVPTGYKKGMIEMVSDAETLRKIQVEWGLTGSFKDKPISEWLARQNPSQLEYQRAVYNFTVSCAGYSVATYILGICDRHNDNIMLKTSGHLFHIDFGKFLGDAQMFGNFKRDRTPFVLTSDMAYVINGGDRPSPKFHYFVDLCCQAFNIVRKHSDLLLHMLALMATSGIPGVTADAVNYVRTALLPGQSNPEAAASFAKMIHISLKSWFTQFNFFLHNLAQLRFSGDEGNGELLNFVPRTYTMAQDGRLKSVTVLGYQKRYDIEKYYTYILQVTRQNQPDPAYLFRSYKEFSELHQKLCLHYPLAKLHSLPSGIHMGRSNIKTVADRRLPEIRQFLISLFDSADEIAHSDLVYTFFHPLLRDQQEQDIHVAKVKEPKLANNTNDRVCGEIKISIQYHRGALILMIHHAKSLPITTSGQEPNTYVKAYLKPDPSKVTKRKTKVVRKNCFPSFMETLEYRMPLEYIQNRILQVTIWSHDSLQENEFLGGIELPLAEYDLKEELVKWFPLGYLSRSKGLF